EGQTKNTPQTVSIHAASARFDFNSFVASRPRTTIMGVNAAVMCGISLLTNALLTQITAAKVRLARRDAWRGSDFLATMMHLPITYPAARTRTTVSFEGSCHEIPMLLWYPR